MRKALPVQQGVKWNTRTSTETQVEPERPLDIATTLGGDVPMRLFEIFVSSQMNLNEAQFQRSVSPLVSLQTSWNHLLVLRCGCPLPVWVFSVLSIRKTYLRNNPVKLHTLSLLHVTHRSLILLKKGVFIRCCYSMLSRRPHLPTIQLLTRLILLLLMERINALSEDYHGI